VSRACDNGVRKHSRRHGAGEPDQNGRLEAIGGSLQDKKC
jgi:hypothetical protein